MWGLTQQEWAIYLGMVTAIIAVLSFMIQIWLTSHKVKLYQAQLRTIQSGSHPSGNEDKAS